HSPSLFSPPPSPTNIYTLSLHDALPIYFVESSSYEINNRGTDGLEMFGIKKYSHEDNLNHVHWKLTSKFDELIVKELTETVNDRSEEHTSELQSRFDLVCRLLLAKKNNT